MTVSWWNELMKRLVASVGIAVVLLAGCANGDKSEDKATPSASHKSSESPKPPENLVPDAVTSFSCKGTSDGQWIAAGELRNSDDVAHTYRVTVFLGSGEGTAHSQEVGPVAAKKTAEFNFGVLTPGDPQATCRVQVEKLDKK